MKNYIRQFSIILILCAVFKSRAQSTLNPMPFDVLSLKQKGDLDLLVGYHFGAKVGGLSCHAAYSPTKFTSILISYMGFEPKNINYTSFNFGTPGPTYTTYTFKYQNCHELGASLGMYSPADKIQIQSHLGFAYGHRSIIDSKNSNTSVFDINYHKYYFQSAIKFSRQSYYWAMFIRLNYLRINQAEINVKYEQFTNNFKRLQSLNPSTQPELGFTTGLNFGKLYLEFVYNLFVREVNYLNMNQSGFRLGLGMALNTISNKKSKK